MRQGDAGGMAYLLAMCALCAALGNPAAEKDADPLAGFRQGVNLSHWYAQSLGEGYGEERLKRYMTREDFRLIRAMGFDHVRLTLDDTVLFDPEAPGTLRPDALVTFRERLGQLHDAGLNVVVDLHPEDPFKRALHEPARQEALVANWRALAGALADLEPTRVWFEVLNEPQDHWPAEQWRPLQRRILTAMREAAPNHTIVVNGGNWSGYDTLPAFEPYDEPNLVYTFHWYEPFMLTHQAAEWGWEPAMRVEGLPWPVESEQAEAVTARVTTNPESIQHLKWQIEHGYFTPQWTRDKLDQVADWQAKHGGPERVPVYVGEFGIYAKAAPAESRVRWYEFCAREFERRGWGWATWDYAGGFGMVETDADGRRRIDRAMQQALFPDDTD